MSSPIRGKGRENLDLEQARVILTTYDLVRAGELETYFQTTGNLFHNRGLFSMRHIRSETSRRPLIVSVFKIRTHCHEAFLLTGTTIHNQFEDFQTLCQFLGVSCQGSKGTLPPHYYRLLKEDVGEIKLPPKVIHEHHLKLDPLHQESYDALYEGARTMYQQYLLNPSLVDISCVLTKILRLRHSCNHIDACLEAEDYRQPKLRHPNVASAKFEKIMELIQEMPAGDKMIIYSQWSQTLDLLTQRLREDNITYYQYNGEMTLTQKNSILDQFRKVPTSAVLLMTIQSGASAVNLADAASHIILCESWWNRALEEQAID